MGMFLIGVLTAFLSFVALGLYLEHTQPDSVDYEDEGYELNTVDDANSGNRI